MRRRFLRPVLLGLLGLLGLVGLFWASPASAEDIPVSNPLALIDEARALIKAEDWAGAIDRLETARPMAERNADLFNLLGFARRKSGDLDRAGRAYEKALALDPDHRGALEYQGELFLMRGVVAAARANLARLTALCGACEERAELAEAIAATESRR